MKTGPVTVETRQSEKAHVSSSENAPLLPAPPIWLGCHWLPVNCLGAAPLLNRRTGDSLGFFRLWLNSLLGPQFHFELMAL